MLHVQLSDSQQYIFSSETFPRHPHMDIQQLVCTGSNCAPELQASEVHDGK
jgi:hypothetical protein